jgi:hypothetical protein
MTEPRYTDADLAYVEAEFRTLDQLCADRADTPDQIGELIGAGTLPAPSYVLPDGRELFPPDYFALIDAAGGPAGLREHFVQQHRAASSALGLTGIDPEEDWRSYLSGEQGATLRELTPEAMVEKAALVTGIDTLVAEPAPDDEGWRERLATEVDDLDELLPPFTDYDRQRWGGTSRDSHVTGVRARFLSSDATTG